MKLKKIASLALAGAMAVSMLTGCSTANNTEEPTTPPVEPVDTSFATAVNAEMGGATKNVLTFDSDATLANVLEKVADKISSYTLAESMKSNDGFVLTSDARDFRHLLGLGRDNSLAYSDLGYKAPLTTSTGTLVANTTDNQKAGSNCWSYFSNYATSNSTVADLVVVPGSLTEEGVAEVVATYAQKLIDNDRMPNDGSYDGKEYKYDYTGDIACVKITNLSGDGVAYVVGFTVTQTATQVTNVK